MTSFFVPGADPDDAEGRYVELAGMVELDVPPPAARVRSLRFTQDAEMWSATVGEYLTGHLASGRGGRVSRTSDPRSPHTRRVSDPATVQAIFDAGEVYLILTDAPPVGNVGDSTWANPVRVTPRLARDVRRFDE